MKITTGAMLASGAAAAMLLSIYSRPGSAEAAVPGFYTVEQAAAGKRAVDVSCGQCHLASLKGRVGDAGELPEVDSLTPKWREFVESSAGQVPTLVGTEFLAKFGEKPLSQFSREQIWGAMQSFGPPGLAAKQDKTVYLDITAYILQMNGVPAGKQPLTADDARLVRTML